ncbi:hypothetical protein AAFJ72_05950 [Brevibacillus gelatini]|uniref:Uncharacterized protein n=1 Tax=Brevibacillus gelatini TaxID=1655277 RepID=A0A3M8B1K3_9BACL|nr:hypothetical protein [Brevibacillus gelatini]RNB56857.1 hypothetical protein EDM57_11060 [Brevibacillus gelatini]
MRKSKIVLLFGSYLLAFLIGGFSQNVFSYAENVHGAYLSDDERKDLVTITNKFDEKFKPIGFEELLQGNENILTAPDSILGDQQEDADTSIFGRQKNYIYKNKSNGTIILMSVSKRLGVQHEQWQHSIYYSNARYNSPDNDLKAYYADIYPPINAYHYSFEKFGYSVSCILVSNSSYDSGANTLAEFVKQVDIFLRENV